MGPMDSHGNPMESCICVFPGTGMGKKNGNDRVWNAALLENSHVIVGYVK